MKVTAETAALCDEVSLSELRMSLRGALIRGYCPIYNKDSGPPRREKEIEIRERFGLPPMLAEEQRYREAMLRAEIARQMWELRRKQP